MKHWVVYGCEHLRDGIEEWAKVVSSVEEALAYINSGRFQHNYTFKIFELGKEVPIKQRTVKEEQKVVVKEHTVYEVE
jgi:hypothetical protein